MPKKITYKQSGVDIRKANRFVEGIGKLAASSMNASVLKRKGSFGALFSFDPSGFKKPVLVSSTDGVGTKLLLAQSLKKHDTVGIDLVAMNVNDILCAGAKPMFFLDYIACGKLQPNILNSVMKGIVKGCELAGCSLIGGETAEMPGMYRADDYDLAGFAVGVVEEDKIIDGAGIDEGDCVIGLASSGFHSNGYSLVRKIFSKIEQKKFSRELLEPTRIYVRPILKLFEKFTIKGMAHITGGAFYEKLTKILPDGKCFQIDPSSWEPPEVFQLLKKKGNVSFKDMFTTFNMGIGMALVVAPADAVEIQKFLSGEGLQSWKIGEVVADRKVKIRFLKR